MFINGRVDSTSLSEKNAEGSFYPMENRTLSRVDDARFGI
jgi:hypothetical protein